MEKWYVGVGEITCPDVAEMWGKKLGDPEYQFSNGPAGKRAFSQDYPSLIEGIQHVCKNGAIIIWDGIGHDDPENNSEAVEALRMEVSDEGA